jgi:hypothetical protein
LLTANQIKYDEKKTEDANKLELYRLIGEGYKAMQEGRTSSIDDVVERMEARRKELYG